LRTRAEYLDEGIDLVRALWEGGSSYHGRHYTFDRQRADLVELGRIADVLLLRMALGNERDRTALGDGRLAEHVAAHPVRFSQRAYVDVALCASGYPASPRRGDRITVEDLPDDVWTFHAGTRRGPDGGFITDGGRVLHIVAQGDTVAEARRKAYLGAERVHFEGKFYRQDIAEDRLGVSS